MPDTTRRRRGGIDLLLAVLSGLVVGFVLDARRRREPAAIETIWKPAEPPPPAAKVIELPRRRGALPVRLGVAAVYAVLFFAGASVAAVAGDALVGSSSSAGDAASAAAPLDAGAAAAPADTSPADDAPATPEPAPADPAPVDPAPAAPAPAPPPAPANAVHPAVVDPGASEAPASTDATAAVSTTSDTTSTDAAPTSPTSTDTAAPSALQSSTAPAVPASSEPAAAPVVAPSAATSAHVAVAHRPAAEKARSVARPAPARDASEAPTTAFPLPYASLTWVSRFAPPAVPQPPLLTRQLGRRLLFASQRADARWPLVLAILQARGEKATPTALQALAPRVGAALAEHGTDAWGAALAVVGDTAAADRAVALMHFDRAVGLGTLVTGLDASKDRLVRRVLDDPRISIYPGGRDDLAAGHVDVRVVAVIAYLADTFGSVDVSSLVSGHRLYARPGVISAHVFGRAVDIAAIGGVPIEGNQQPGGITEKAVRALLLLPPSMEPTQIISLLGLGGPSFPLADHYDHIHVGY